mmetsp:Transcript_21216/g.50227  ORF Transcript_21216/g.50227 Transcript_21216/m.50227 type:complete len:812 (+) Transcript_21216:655-3090(+)
MPVEAVLPRAHVAAQVRVVAEELGQAFLDVLPVRSDLDGGRNEERHCGHSLDGRDHGRPCNILERATSARASNRRHMRSLARSTVQALGLNRRLALGPRRPDVAEHDRDRSAGQDRADDESEQRARSSKEAHGGRDKEHVEGREEDAHDRGVDGSSHNHGRVALLVLVLLELADRLVKERAGRLADSQRVDASIADDGERASDSEAEHQTVPNVINAEGAAHLQRGLLIERPHDGKRRDYRDANRPSAHLGGKALARHHEGDSGLTSTLDVGRVERVVGAVDDGRDARGRHGKAERRADADCGTRHAEVASDGVGHDGADGERHERRDGRDHGHAEALHKEGGGPGEAGCRDRLGREPAVRGEEGGALPDDKRREETDEVSSEVLPPRVLAAEPAVEVGVDDASHDRGEEEDEGSSGVKSVAHAPQHSVVPVHDRRGRGVAAHREPPNEAREEVASREPEGKHDLGHVTLGQHGHRQHGQEHRLSNVKEHATAIHDNRSNLVGHGRRVAQLVKCVLLKLPVKEDLRANLCGLGKHSRACTEDESHSGHTHAPRNHRLNSISMPAQGAHGIARGGRIPFQPGEAAAVGEDEEPQREENQKSRKQEVSRRRSCSEGSAQSRAEAREVQRRLASGPYNATDDHGHGQRHEDERSDNRHEVCRSIADAVCPIVLPEGREDDQDEDEEDDHENGNTKGSSEKETLNAHLDQLPQPVHPQPPNRIDVAHRPSFNHDHENDGDNHQEETSAEGEADHFRGIQVTWICGSQELGSEVLPIFTNSIARMADLVQSRVKGRGRKPCNGSDKTVPHCPSPSA